MTSARKLQANRLNSRSSTGPKTAAGRATSAGNARRHGLRVPVLSDPVLSAQVEIMAQKIAAAAPELVELARRVAEAPHFGRTKPTDLIKAKSKTCPHSAVGGLWNPVPVDW